MDNDQVKHQEAQPAREELKKHGDQLAKPVGDATGKKQQEPEKPQNGVNR